MTAPRVAIVRSCMLRFGHQDIDKESEAIVRELDAAMQSPETVERAARAIWLKRFPEVPWPPANEQDAEDHRGFARAALAAAIGGTK